MELKMTSCFVVYDKFRSLSLKEDNRLKVFEGRLWKIIGGSDTEKNRKENGKDLRKIPYRAIT
jgi:hypothetical protein